MLSLAHVVRLVPQYYIEGAGGQRMVTHVDDDDNQARQRGLKRYFLIFDDLGGQFESHTARIGRRESRHFEARQRRRSRCAGDRSAPRRLRRRRMRPPNGRRSSTAVGSGTVVTSANGATPLVGNGAPCAWTLLSMMP